MSCSSSSCSSEASLEVVDVAECNVPESESSESSSNPEILKWERGAWQEELAMEDPPWHIALMVKFSCVVMFLAGMFADWLRMRGFIKVKVATDDPRHKLLKPTSTNCKDYDELVDADDAKQAVIYNEKYADLFKLLGNETGIANFSYANVNRIYNVERELIHNMTEKQPEWVFKKWEEYDGKSTMEIIGELRRIRMMTKFNSPEKAMYMGSFLLNNFIENAQKVANGSMKNPDKMLLYSSHDGTVLGLMYAMNVANDLMVPYASALIMEIYKDGDEFFTELLFRNDTSRPAYKLPIPWCGDPCTVKKLALYPNAVLSSYAEQQNLCGTPLPECKGSAKLITHVLSVALVMTIFM
ncbi:hypothetical protein Y032_0123g1159 [Ancylostoma ceylanicum]|uniref:Histidine acid phosphatase n=1 Tax=Ancylostoma ceylanicum TaxID=53326 RepID=A0A016T9K4_9BILA|nr:hypothetical protein Y032_0123g1159 [Ancylostoma ceylanicum]